MNNPRTATAALLLYTFLIGAAAWAVPGYAASALPFDMPSTETLRQSPKKVFALYVPWHPISLDNLPANQDLYTTQLMDPAGEGGQHLGYGGLLRARPIPQPVVQDVQWELRNMEKEVRRAINIGLDGFLVDIVMTSGPLWDRVLLLIQAAANVDPGFRIVLMPDMEGIFKIDPAQLGPAIRKLSQYPNVFRLDDGRLVLQVFSAQVQGPAAWANWLAAMKASGIDIAFVPLFQQWELYAADYQSVSAGFADWGMSSGVASSQDHWRQAPTVAHQYVPIWAAPVRPQGAWPKSLTYREAGASMNFRKTWTTAILGKAEWVNLITWNDYVEGTQMAPSTGTQHSFFDLTAYYLTWFKTGKAPTIVRDVVYYFHRLHHTMAVPDWSKQTAGPFRFYREWPTDARRDLIEVVAFLTEPATVEIRIGTTKQSFSGVAGQNLFTMPIAEGRPSFRVIRQGGPVIDFQSAFSISNTIVYQDLLYRGGSSSRAPVATQ